MIENKNITVFIPTAGVGSRLKNLTKAVRVAVANNDKEAALSALKDVNKSFHSFVSKGFLKKETASRKVSRLAKLVNTLAA